MFGGGSALLAISVFAMVVHKSELRLKSEKFSRSADPKCGYKSCHPTKPKMLNVHLVAHSHNDVGWLKTVDQYYNGTGPHIQVACVRCVLNSVVNALLKDPKKRFIYVESAFFFKWWKEQTSERQEEVKMLVNEGRLEFIGGAWSMNDEATTHYQSIIDQFSWGLRLLNETFGTCGRPRIGWQIDPFGHSREMASIFAQMGFDGLFLDRLDYQDKDERLMTQKAEMIWRGSSNLGKDSYLFTGTLYNGYHPPDGFCFDRLCSNEDIIDGKHNRYNNVKEQVDKFLDYVVIQSRHYRTNNVLVTMGGDFYFEEADVYYKNIDKLIRYANARQEKGSNINLLYSTPSCYLKSVHATRINWPTKSDDFFPYASDSHTYWTGYFTSRPTLKRFERDGNHFLQVCKQLSALAPNKSAEFSANLAYMREAMGVMQHHDAVTGTEKQKVAFDYAKRLSEGLSACAANTRSILNQIATSNKHPGDSQSRYPFEFKTCSLLNISSCAITESTKQFTLTLYNPLAHETSEYVRIPVSEYIYTVTDHKGDSLPTQIVPLPDAILAIKHRNSTAKHELVFLASNVPAVGYRTYYIKNLGKNAKLSKPYSKPKKTANVVQIGNQDFLLTFDKNGLLSNVTTDGMTRMVSQTFLYYEGKVEINTEPLQRSSGAYIFRPKKNGIHFINDELDIKVYKGKLVEEVHQKFNDWISQVVRVYRKQNYAEFEWLVGPIPIDDNIGKEIISRFNSDIKSAKIFYTDSNGREMIRRERNFRQTWNLKLDEPIAGNYYPVTTKIALEDSRARMAILTDRAQGGSSLEDGSLELMVHRRLLSDDSLGVGEALNEMEYRKGLIARGKHYLLVGQSYLRKEVSMQAIERITQLKVFLPTWKFFSNMESYSKTEWRMNFKNHYTGITLALPKTIHMLTFEPWKRENELLVRFEHILEKHEDSQCSQGVQFNIKNVFRNFKIQSIRETTLDGNAWLDDISRFNFYADDTERQYKQEYPLSETRTKHLLSAKNSFLRTKYSDEVLRVGNLGAESNRLKQESFSPLALDTKLAPQSGDSIKISLSDNNDEEKYIIELIPMQIRTFVITLRTV